ncbi:MAG: VWA domain-containing protein [Pyrinomonadaceae bacterium]|nr:VWA domain-containing protein [Pyrinomonadaceae bacterium]
MKRFVAVVLLALAGVASAQSDDEVIRVDSSIVVVNASITDRLGNPAIGLARPYFRVFEDGVEQSIDTFSAEETPFAAVVLIDTSGSMESRLSVARSAAIEFLYGLRRDDNCSVQQFNSKVELVQEFSNSRDIRERIFDIKAKGMTVLNDAIFMAAKTLEGRPEKRRAIVVLSDGEDTMSRRSAAKALDAALAADANIYTVDMAGLEAGTQSGRIQNQAALKRFAEKTGGRFIATPNGIAMRDALRDIVRELGGQYTVTYQSKNPVRDGKWRSIEVRVSKPNLTIRTRKGYNAPKQ